MREQQCVSNDEHQHDCGTGRIHGHVARFLTHQRREEHASHGGKVTQQDWQTFGGIAGQRANAALATPSHVPTAQGSAESQANQGSVAKAHVLVIGKDKETDDHKDQPET